MRSDALWVCAVVLACSLANAATYYISPTGNDGAAGTSAGTPWKTFAFAIPKLKPGDSLILLDGTYDASNSGYPSLKTLSGTATQLITIKAQNERKAFIKGNGTARPVWIEGCHYLTLEGLRIEEGDFATASGGTLVMLKASDHIVIRRFLMEKDNRYENSAMVLLEGTNNSLFEENEIYQYHRLGFQISYGNNNVFRRNYANSRGHADIGDCISKSGDPGCLSAYGESTRGDGGFWIYSGPANSNIFENNISEGNGQGFYVNANTQLIRNTKFLGNISLNDSRGMFATGGPTSNGMSIKTTVENHVSLQPRARGFEFGSADSVFCTNATTINSGKNSTFAEGHGLIAYKIPHAPGYGKYSFFGKNLLILDGAFKGIRVTTDIQNWSLSNSNSYLNANMNYDPATNLNYASTISVDPKLGACKVWIPDSSPMKQAGIGASVLYRYVNGSLTQEPLWDPRTGEFPRGAVIAGVNDIPGQSLFDVHKRLNVNCNGCSFPAGYANTGIVEGKSMGVGRKTLVVRATGSGINIQWNGQNKTNATIYSLHGKKLGSIENIESHGMWNPGKSAAGVYLVKVEAGNVVQTAKVFCGR